VGATTLSAGANPAFMVDYMFYRGKYHFGMPSDREETLFYLENLKRLKQDLGMSQ